jgi:prevent-host-death family protein
MPKSIDVQTLCRDLSQVLDEVASSRQIYIVESSGRPTAILLSMDEYGRLQASSPEQESTPARIVSPRLVNPAQITDFELEIVEEGANA